MTTMSFSFKYPFFLFFFKDKKKKCFLRLCNLNAAANMFTYKLIKTKTCALS